MYWYSWLGFVGLLLGLTGSALINLSPLRSGLLGLAAGIVAVVIVNAVMPTSAPCLQQAKGWDILRAYWICP